MGYTVMWLLKFYFNPRLTEKAKKHLFQTWNTKKKPFIRQKQFPIIESLMKMQKLSKIGGSQE